MILRILKTLENVSLNVYIDHEDQWYKNRARPPITVKTRVTLFSRDGMFVYRFVVDLTGEHRMTVR